MVATVSLSTASTCVTAVVAVFIVPFKSPEKVVAVTSPERITMFGLALLPKVAPTAPSK